MALFSNFGKSKTVKLEHRKWHSQILGKEMNMLVFGEYGYPIIIFPTSMGSFTQNRDFHLLDSVTSYIDTGLVKIYTPSSIDNESWYNQNIPPADRARNHILYDHFVMNEIVIPALQETGHNKAAFAGCSFGAYHALNFGLRHPEVTGYVISMGGAFDIKDRVKGYYDDNVYFNNPPDYLPGLKDERIKEIGFIFGTGTRDMCMEANRQMSALLVKKGVANYLDIIEGAEHDWPAWREMFGRYVGMAVEQMAGINSRD